jgi:hypothetical protein
MPRRTEQTQYADQRAYELRQEGNGWAGIALQLGMTGESVARAAANRHAQRIGIIRGVDARRAAAGRLAAQRRFNRQTTPLTVEGRANLIFIGGDTILPLNQRTFGVEIEFTGKYKFQAARDIALALHETGVQVPQYMGVPHIHTMGYHGDRCEVCGETVQNKYLQWRIERDASVTQYRGTQEFGGEVVSPILVTPEFAQLNTVLKALRLPTEYQGGTFGGKVNAQCGLHIHVGVKDLTPAQRAKIVRHWYNTTAVIHTFVAQSRINNHYCAQMPQREVDQVVALLELNVAHVHTYERTTNKYRSLNVLPFPKIGTFEFRLHQGTLNATKVRNWVTLLLAFVGGFATEEQAPVGHTVERTERFLDILVAKTQAPTNLKKYFIHRQGVLVPDLRRPVVTVPETTDEVEDF